MRCHTLIDLTDERANIVKKRTYAWNRLDNAAKIFPSTTNKNDTKVFRVACELTEEIDPVILKLALDETLQQFPVFLSTLKRGLFWYYLERSNIKPEIGLETTAPCSTLYIDKEQLLFEVTYYMHRINLEVHHILTDGMGAFQFLRSLILHYLIIKYPSTFKDFVFDIGYDATEFEKIDDSFDRYYSNQNKYKININQQAPENAFQIRGSKLPEQQLLIIEGIVNTKAILEKAHQYKATLTEFICAVFVYSIYNEMKIRERNKPVVINIPVNLRKFFPSLSARNFFSVINVGYKFDSNDPYISDFDILETELFSKVLSNIKNDFKKNLTKENLQIRLDQLMWAEKNIFSRIIPLVIKDITLKMIHGTALKKSTASMSNLGNVEMPEQAKPYIKTIDAFVSTSKIQMVMCTYEGSLTMSITSKYLNTHIQKNFFKILSSTGIEVRILSNQPNI